MAQLSERVEENMKRFSRKENSIESNTVPGSRVDQGKAFDTGSNILRTGCGETAQLLLPCSLSREGGLA